MLKSSTLMGSSKSRNALVEGWPVFIVSEELLQNGFLTDVKGICPRQQKQLHPRVSPKPRLTRGESNPSSIAVDSSNGDVYIADGYGNSRVVVFDRDGKFLLQ